MQLRTFRVYISVTEHLHTDIKASYADARNGILHLVVIEKVQEGMAEVVKYRDVAAFMDWQFYEVLDD